VEAYLSPPLAELASVWSEEDTTPSRIADALQHLLVEAHREERSYVPARVLNLVVVVDRQFKGEVANRLERVGRYHPSRTILVAVEPRRDTIDSFAQVSCEVADGGLAVAIEHVEIDVGPRHLLKLDTIVDPLIVTDLTTVIWAPHGQEDAIDAMRRLIQVVLLDSVQEAHAGQAIRRAADLASDAYVVDLAWLRSTPWRERIAATFDPPIWRHALREISGVTIRAREDSLVPGLLLLGWLSCRLGWKPGELISRDGTWHGKAHGRRQDVNVRVESAPHLGVPGLDGVEIETASGMRVSLVRGPGGLRATRRLPDGHESSWVVLGASRGEAGILGEGIRQALLRDPTYRPSLDCALAYLGA
jgi:glucose-6-phosphate dehydrogenase assembly protein OpcA